MPKRYAQSTQRAFAYPRKMVSYGSNRSRDDDDDDEGLDLMAPPFRIFGSLPREGEDKDAAPSRIDIYISRDIMEASAYDELCHVLRQANETDDVTMYINSPGGDITGGLAIIQAMQDSPATIKTVLHPCAFSMGSLIFLAGDEYEVPPFAHMMLHIFRGGHQGKGNELRTELQASLDWFEAVLREICEGFLTDEEQQQMLDGRDFWLQAPEIMERLERLEALGEAQAGG